MKISLKCYQWNVFVSIAKHITNIINGNQKYTPIHRNQLKTQSSNYLVLFVQPKRMTISVAYFFRWPTFFCCYLARSAVRMCQTWLTRDCFLFIYIYISSNKHPSRLKCQIDAEAPTKSMTTRLH